ncbi:MAG: pyridoxine 5'-phosphate synthase [Desulfotalea sp.]
MSIIIQCKEVTLPISPKTIEDFSISILQRLNISDHNLSLVFTSDDEMAWFNHHYRSKNGPTNVLSFPFSDGCEPAIEQLPIKELGDIIISVDTAMREAIQFNQSMETRFKWLIVHGILHLIGYDHEQGEDEEAEMLAKEQELLENHIIHRSNKMTHLAINVDHIATIREARGIREPDPVTAAAICEMAGACGIVAHLREDRRHMQDRDIIMLRETIKTKLNFEMGANKEIIKFALKIKPDIVTLVPEKRQELTTEGGLDVAGQKKKLAKTIELMAAKNIPVSLFIDPVEEQIVAAKKIGAQFVELHTGRYCDTVSEVRKDSELQLIRTAAREASAIGLRVAAGHGLGYHDTAAIAAIEEIEELSIGHSIIARAVFSGLETAVRDMLKIVQQAR